MPPASGGILSGANAEINLVVIMVQIYNTGCRESVYTPYSLMLFKKKHSIDLSTFQPFKKKNKIVISNLKNIIYYIYYYNNIYNI